MFPSPASARRRRRRNPVWITAAAVIVVGCASAGFALASHDSGSPPKPKSTTSVHHVGARARATASPRATVEAFIAAINAAIKNHDWHKVWQLGGKNLGRPYPTMVAGFSHTRNDHLTRIVSHADTVHAWILAHETTGAVQTIALTYTVRAGIITHGVQRVLATRYPPAGQSG
jgi:hypothetical protein